jgi:REP element-mobilizing transposase RayT
MRNPAKGHAALRLGRVSIPNAEYFLTICTDKARAGLTTPATAGFILREMHAMEADQSWQLRCAVIMPDHLHVLATLGERLPLGRCVARLKSKTAGALRSVAAELEWERDFFDQRLRPDEDRQSVFLYIYLNPYRAGLCPRAERWPWYYCRAEDWVWFKDHLDDERPPPEWLNG